MCVREMHSAGEALDPDGALRAGFGLVEAPGRKRSLFTGSLLLPPVEGSAGHGAL